MKFLGFMGVLLWLGTLLANAGSAEKASAAFASLEEWGVQADLAPTPFAAKADKADKDDSHKAPPGTVEAGADQHIRPLLVFGACRPDSDIRANSESLIAWHFGQGPPSACA